MMSIYYASILTNMMLITFLALSAYLVLIVGEISFGQQAFFGIGAYVIATATTLLEMNIVIALILSVVAGGIAALILAVLTVRLSGLYFAIASLAFAELFRLVMLRVRAPIEVEGRITGPDGPEGFRNIRWMFENNYEVTDFLLLTVVFVFILLCLLLLAERTRPMRHARLVGKDSILAQSLGICPTVYRITFIGLSGMVAAFGGALFALFSTYIEPSMFGVMLGVHALAYSIIGGLGTPIGPLIGVAIDIGLLESIRALSSYRMIVFGGLVAVLLIVFPEGLIGPRTAARIKARLTRPNA